MSEDLTFEQWWKQLQSIGEKEGYPIDYGKEAFKEMYEDGLSPQEAFWEEINAAKSFV